MITNIKEVSQRSGPSQSSGYFSRGCKTMVTLESTGLRQIESDIQGLLKVLLITSDMELQVNILGILEGAIISKKADVDAIVRCDSIYDIINRILIRGLPSKSTSTLNFICALLYLEDWDATPNHRRIIAVYARNMIRASGCLSTMCNMFTDGTMMYQDKWAALCRCLAEVCRCTEVNQSVCAYLIPMCVHKCRSGNIEVLLVLKSLLDNNRLNLQTFLDNRGLSIFNRELLQYDTCMQILYNAVRISKEARNSIRNSNVHQYLTGIILQHGKLSQIGSWSALILKNIDSQIEEAHIEKGRDCSPAKIETATFVINHTDEENTTTLFKNIAKEIYPWHLKQQQCERSNKSIGKYYNEKEKQLPSSKADLRNAVLKNYKNNIRSSTAYSNELSFSFLNTSWHLEMSSLRNGLKRSLLKNDSNINLSKGIHISQLESTFLHNFSKLTKLDLTKKKGLQGRSLEFRPTFASTPRSKEKRPARLRKIFSKVSSCEKRFDESQIPERESKSQSTSARFFNAINDSCTTVVQTITSIFKSSKKPSNPAQENKPKNLDCSYSFTNYMKQRDALSNEYSNSTLETDQSSKNIVKFCKTCNDTQFLKQKLANDKYLRQTLKKLKMGINLFGCDFKKISKTMWPRDTYMKPFVLQNLYKKLLVKYK